KYYVIPFTYRLSYSDVLLSPQRPRRPFDRTHFGATQMNESRDNDMRNSMTHPVSTRRTFLAIAASAGAFAAAALAAPATVFAQDNFPTRPITLVVPFPPGGPTDVGARMVGKFLGEELGQAIVVENKAGAGGTLGSTY